MVYLSDSKSTEIVIENILPLAMILAWGDLKIHPLVLSTDMQILFPHGSHSERLLPFLFF